MSEPSFLKPLAVGFRIRFVITLSIVFEHLINLFKGDLVTDHAIVLVTKVVKRVLLASLVAEVDGSGRRGDGDAAERLH